MSLIHFNGVLPKEVKERIKQQIFSKRLDCISFYHLVVMQGSGLETGY